MTINVTQQGVGTALAFIASVASAVLPLLVANNVLSADTASVIGGIVTAVLAGFHGNNQAVKAQARRAAKQTGQPA